METNEILIKIKTLCKIILIYRHKINNKHSKLNSLIIY